MSNDNTESVHFLDYWQILYSRKEIVIAVTLLMLLTGIAITRAMPRVYAATARIRVQRETTDIDIFGPSYNRYDPFFLKGQYEILRSAPIMEEVVRELHLDEELGRAYNYIERYSAADCFDRTVRLVRSKMLLDIVRDTDHITITMKFDKPDTPEGEAARLAARTANTVARVFRAWTDRQSRDIRKNALSALQQELDEHNRKTFEAERKVDELREKYGLTVIGEADSGAQSIRLEIATLAARQTQISLETTAKRMRYEQIAAMPTKDLAGSMNFLTGEGTVAALLATKQTMEMELNALTRASLGPSHPDVVRIRAMVDELDAKIDEGVNTVKRAMRLEYERSQAELDGLAEKLAELKEQERKLSASGVAEYERARTDLSVMNARGAFLEDRLAKEMLTLKLPSTSVQLLEEAKVNPNDPPVSPNFALNVMLSLFAGLFFGVVLAFFVEYLDTSVKTVDDIEKHLAASVLGIIPQKIRHLNDPSARPGHSEPYRVLRTNIKSSKTLADGKVISVTSSSAGEGKTQTLFNLAYVSADVGDRVLLIDSDLHRPRLHKVLDMDNDRGLCNVIVGEVSIEEAIRETDNPNLHFLPSGRLSSASVHGLLDTEEMTNIIKELSPHYDRIFLDSPPIVGVSDAVQLARMVDGVILVVQHRKYPRTLAKRASEMIVNMGGNLIGVVLNNINVSRDYSSYYYKHQYYYYSYGYTTPGKS